MLMDMMQVRCMRVSMCYWFMRMSVTMNSYRYLTMAVGMVSVIMGMGVFMLQHLILMLVFMPFRDMQNDTRYHQRRAA